MTEERKKEVLLNALKYYYWECKKLAHRNPSFSAIRIEADDVAEIIREVMEEWTD